MKSNAINNLKIDGVKRAQQALKKARTVTRMLEKANNGDLEAFSKILMYVHGRQGARKRLLLKELLQKEESSIPKDDAALRDLIAHPRGPEALEYQAGGKFFEFIKSQQANQLAVKHKGVIRRVRPWIPSSNIWMRPMPLKRQAGLRRRWLAETLEKILPPIPHQEWHRLADLAIGVLPLDDPPPRRAAPVRDFHEQWSSDPKDVLNCLVKRPSDPDIKTDYIKLGPDGALYANMDTNREKLERESKREVTPRSIRRTYAAIWNMTATMYQEGEPKKWIVKWGKQKSEYHNGAVSLPSEAEKDLFEGLEGLVSIPAQTRTRNARSISVERTLKKLTRQNAEAGTINPLLPPVSPIPRRSE